MPAPFSFTHTLNATAIFCTVAPHTLEDGSVAYIVFVQTEPNTPEAVMHVRSNAGESKHVTARKLADAIRELLTDDWWTSPA